MSWIKKIVAFLNADDIEEELENKIKKEKTELETESKAVRQKNEMNQEKKNDMNTRVTYQYPKGEFRFPVMPDTTEKEIQNKKIRPTVNNQQYFEDEQENVRIETPKRNKVRPFKPAEIPSPIYGFGGREKEEIEDETMQEAIEYELNHSFVTSEKKKNEAEIQYEINQEVEDTSMNEQQETVEYIQSEKEEGLVIGEEIIEEPITPIENVVEQECVDELVDDGDNIKEIIADEENNYGITKEQNESKEQAENIIEVEEPVGINEEELVQEEPVKVDEEELVQEEPKEPRRKKQVPFNVLMLKNDRQRLKERSERRKQGKNESVQTELNNEQQVETIDEVESNVSMQQTTEELVSEPKKVGYYEYPSIDLLSPPIVREENDEWLDEQVGLLNETLQNFNVQANVVKVSQGPSVTRFEVQPDPGVKVSRVKNLTDDIKLSMAAKDIRMEAPIPGKRSIGIEIPNTESRPVQISELIKSPLFEQYESPLTAVLGLDISGAPIITDLNKMPHGLIAGATGSGKSVCINSILISLLYKARPDEVKLLLIDPKMVELAPYNHIPHLISPVITDVKAATASLKWAVDEMERRYELFLHTSVRDISKYNELADKNNEWDKKLPYIVIVIDELADLMMMAPTDVEESISRIAQKARACGIHLLIATQRPSVDVITGLIKANVPTRVAFSVSSQIDSRTIIDIGGAEKLLGRGDMLFLENGSNKPVRVQGTYVSDDEIDRVIEHVRKQGTPQYVFEQEELLKKADSQNAEDELFLEACEFIVQQGSASTSLLQRQFRIGYNRAARLMDVLEEKGVISEARGSRARDVLITEADLEQLSI